VKTSSITTDSAASSTRRRIVVVDDHEIMRDGLRAVINREPDLEVCAQTGDALTALTLVASTKPDLVLVDITLTGRSGMELIRDLHVQSPKLPILALSMHEESLYAQRVLRAGGRGYLMKKEGGERLISAIRQVLAGEIVVSAKVSAKMLASFSGLPSDISPVERLTDRELEVFQLIGQGKDNAAIASELHISSKTVDAHRSRIKEKLRIATSAELISFSARWLE